MKYFSMSHVPERPEEYVCTNCQVIYAGTVHSDDGGHHFSPPENCIGCDDPHWVELEAYVSHHHE